MAVTDGRAGRGETSGGRIAASLFTLLLFLSACTHIYTAKGAYYRVQKGDTLESIAQRHRLDLQDLAGVNNIEDSKSIRPGQNLYLPGVHPTGFARIIKREGGTSEKRRGVKRRETSQEGKKGDRVIEVDHGRFSWPIQGELSSLFGIRRGRRHDGIDIRAKMGSLVSAAADGEVVFSKRMRGYGNLVLMKHENDFFTVYAHNSANLVKKGDRVKKGQKIAKVGRTGRATGPHLHFEVREGTAARNPLFFLPKTHYAVSGDGIGGEGE